MTKIFVSGHRGMVGSALIRNLQRDNKDWELIVKKRDELDLCDQIQVEDFFRKEKPEVVVNAAARVGGIHANSTYPAEFIHQNLTLNTNLIHSAWKYGVERF